MEELRNENNEEQIISEEPIIEQRPSTKYGRTAYQQQLQEEERLRKEQEKAQPYQSEEYQERKYYSFDAEKLYQHEDWKRLENPTLKNVYVKILMVLIAISSVIAFVSNVMASKAYEMGNTLEEVMDAILEIASQPNYQVLTTISDCVFFVTVGLLILDISQVKRAGKSTKGMILFAIFFRPAYFIWRAHLLGERKTVPILYAVSVYAITAVEFWIVMQGAMDMVMRTMY